MKTKNLRLLTFIFITYAAQTIACDDMLKTNPLSKVDPVKAKRECEIQDRFRKVKNTFHDFNLNINNVTEYRAIRLIDRNSWEKNVQLGNAAPKWVYKPMPTTWDVWNNGIQLIFEKNRAIPENILDLKNVIYMNKVLLTDGKNNVKDPISDQGLKPGELRSSMFDPPIGFCSLVDNKTFENIVDASSLAAKQYMKTWEKKAGISLKEIVKKYNGTAASKADLAIGLTVSNGRCKASEGHFIEYIESDKVERSLNWLSIFLDYNSKKYKEGLAVITPIELSAIAQKTFVTVHPFADGNGRTSRAIQDMILEKFDMPYAPGGDLQNDVLEHPETYIESTYISMESMLTFLESCEADLLSGQKLNARCQASND
jgi:hypothetical protein